MKKIVTILIVLGYINILCINSQEKTATIKIDSSVFYFGSPVGVTLEITKNKFDILDYSSIYHISDNFDILKEEKTDSLNYDKDKIKITKKFSLAIYDTGIINIPPLPIIYQNKNSYDTVFTNSLTVYLKPIPIDTTGTIRDIKEIYKVPLTFKEIFSYLLIILLVAGIIILILYFIRKNKKNTFNGKKPEFTEPPDIIALRELDNLKNSKLWQKNEIKLYYTILTDIIRKYIEQRFEINAMEMITDDIIKNIANMIKDEDLKILKDLLYDADMVKFANYKPEPTDNIKHLENAYSFVIHTKPVNLLEESKNTSKNE